MMDPELVGSGAGRELIAIAHPVAVVILQEPGRIIGLRKLKDLLPDVLVELIEVELLGMEKRRESEAKCQESGP